MNTTAAQALTLADLIAGYNHEDFGGYGYLGGRRDALSNLAYKVDITAGLAEIAAADQFVLDTANSRGWDAERLFQWANSRDGRHFADDAFGGFGLERAARLI